MGINLGFFLAVELVLVGLGEGSLEGDLFFDLVLDLTFLAFIGLLVTGLLLLALGLDKKSSTRSFQLELDSAVDNDDGAD